MTGSEICIVELSSSDLCKIVIICDAGLRTPSSYVYLGSHNYFSLVFTDHE